MELNPVKSSQSLFVLEEREKAEYPGKKPLGAQEKNN